METGRTSARAYESIFEYALDAVLLTTPEGAILHANPAACRLFGYSLEELLAIGRPAVVDPSEPRVRAAIEERRRVGHFSGVLPMKRKDGTTFRAHLSSAVFTAPDGQVCTSMFVRDLTEVERREQMLQASNEDLARALAEVQRLRGILPICSYCKNVRDAHNFWMRVEEYISAHSPLQFTHSICPDCYVEHWKGETPP